MRWQDVASPTSCPSESIVRESYSNYEERRELVVSTPG